MFCLIYKFIYFIFVCVGSLIGRGLSLVAASGLLIVVASLAVEQGSRRMGFSSCGTQAQ